MKFVFDVFLSHSSFDKPTVRLIDSYLTSKGLNIWFDERIILPGVSIPAAIENGLQYSKILVFIASKNSLKSDWVTLERQTALFRDPINSERRMITLLIEDVELPEMLQQFSYLDYKYRNNDVLDNIQKMCI